MPPTTMPRNTIGQARYKSGRRQCKAWSEWLSRNMGDEFVFEHVDWEPVLFGNKDFAQLMKKWNLDEFVTLKR